MGRKKFIRVLIAEDYSGWAERVANENQAVKKKERKTKLELERRRGLGRTDYFLYQATRMYRFPRKKRDFWRTVLGNGF